MPFIWAQTMKNNVKADCEIILAWLKINIFYEQARILNILKTSCKNEIV